MYLHKKQKNCLAMSIYRVGMIILVKPLTPNHYTDTEFGRCFRQGGGGGGGKGRGVQIYYILVLLIVYIPYLILISSLSLPFV